MTYLSALIASPATAAPGLTTVQGSGAMKASILLFDYKPGTRNFTAPVTGKYRVAVVGGGISDTVAGGGGGGPGYSEKIFNFTAGTNYPYTIPAGSTGTGIGGTTSFNAVISSTGGNGSAASYAGGVGSGGDINTSGGVGATQTGGASGHRFGNGGNGRTGTNGGGGGWTSAGGDYLGGDGGVDGYGLGLIPGTAQISRNGGYGAGGSFASSGNGLSSNGGMGGGCAVGTNPGLGGGGGITGVSNGIVIVELIG